MKRITFFLGVLFLAVPFAVCGGGEVSADAEPKPVAPELSAEEIRRLQSDPAYRRLKEIERELEPIPNIAKLKHVAANPQGLSDEELRRLKAYAEDKRALARKKWNHVQEMRRKQTFATVAVELRLATHTARLFQLGEIQKARLKEIHEREAEAYGARYPEDHNRPHDRFGIPEHLREWQQSGEYQRFRQEEGELNSWLIREGEKVKKELKTGYTVIEQLIDNMQNEVLGEYQVVVNAVRAIDEELERRRLGEEKKKEEELKLGKLRLRTNASTIDLKTGETAEVWFWVEKGYPPYLIRAFEPSSGNFVDLKFEKAQPFMLPFRFTAPGRYKAKVNAIDRDFDTKTVAFEFNVTAEEKPAEVEKPTVEKKGAETKKEAKKVGEEKKPEEQKARKAVRPPLAPGTYRVHLWSSHLEKPGGGWAQKKAKPDEEGEPIPFDITVDAAGNISGRCDYTFPPRKVR